MDEKEKPVRTRGLQQHPHQWHSRAGGEPSAASKADYAAQQKRTAHLWCPPLRARFYDFGVTRVACVALLIRIALSE
jgi:hypothetical protein